MIETQDLRGNTHYIERCTYDDIPVHAEMVVEYVPEDQFGTYVQNMRKCVDAGTAFKLMDDSCFLYYLNYRPVHAIGYALYGKGVPLKFMALLMGIFRKIDTKTYKLDFKAHQPTFLPDFRSIITKVSLRRRRAPNRPMTIRIDRLKKKITDLAATKGIVWDG